LFQVLKNQACHTFDAPYTSQHCIMMKCGITNSKQLSLFLQIHQQNSQEASVSTYLVFEGCHGDSSLRVGGNTSSNSLKQCRQVVVCNLCEKNCDGFFVAEPLPYCKGGLRFAAFEF
jgi:hypothetical protein